MPIISSCYPLERWFIAGSLATRPHSCSLWDTGISVRNGGVNFPVNISGFLEPVHTSDVAMVLCSRQHEQTWSELMLFVLKDENLAGQAAAAFAEQNPRGAQPLKDADLEQDMLSEVGPGICTPHECRTSTVGGSNAQSSVQDLERIEMAAVKARKPLKRANGAVAPLWEQVGAGAIARNCLQ